MKYTSLILLFATFIISCGDGKKEEQAVNETEQPLSLTLTPVQEKKAGIETGKAEIRNMSMHLKVNGIIDVPPQNMVSITFPPGGYLQSTKLLPGMHVNKGEVIAIMQDSKLIQLQQDYLAAVIRNRQLEEEYKRQQELNRDKSSSDKALQEAEANWKANKISVKALSEQLQLAGIDPSSLDENTISRNVPVRSFIDGYVASVKVNVGAYINPGDVMFELVDPKDIHLNMTVFEKDIEYLAIGQKVKAWTNSQPEKKYDAEIILVGKELDEHRSVEVHCHFESYDKKLLPGMFMNAEIEVNRQAVSTVPDDAVVTYRDHSYVFEAQGGHNYRMVEVKTGMQQEGRTAVSPADAGKSLPENIVTHNAYTLLMQLMNTAEEE